MYATTAFVSILPIYFWERTEKIFWMQLESIAQRAENGMGAFFILNEYVEASNIPTRN